MPAPRYLSPQEAEEMDNPTRLLPGPIIISDDIDLWPCWWFWFWRF